MHNAICRPMELRLMRRPYKVHTSQILRMHTTPKIFSFVDVRYPKFVRDVTQNGRAATGVSERQGLFLCCTFDNACPPPSPPPPMSQHLFYCSFFITLCRVVRESRRWRSLVMGHSRFSHPDDSSSSGYSLPSDAYDELVLASCAPSQFTKTGADDPPCCLLFIRVGIDMLPLEMWVLHVVCCFRLK